MRSRSNQRTEVLPSSERNTMDEADTEDFVLSGAPRRWFTRDEPGVSPPRHREFALSLKGRKMMKKC